MSQLSELVHAECRRVRRKLRLFALAVVLANLLGLLHFASAGASRSVLPWRLMLLGTTFAAIAHIVRERRRLSDAELGLRQLESRRSRGRLRT